MEGSGSMKNERQVFRAAMCQNGSFASFERTTIDALQADALPVNYLVSALTPGSNLAFIAASEFSSSSPMFTRQLPRARNHRGFVCEVYLFPQ